MSILVVAEHDNQELKPSTLNTVGAASQCGDDIHILVAGHNCEEIARACASVDGVSKVIHADNEALAHNLAENLGQMIAGMADAYSHILMPATTFGKNVMPRAAALMDTQQISDITKIVDAETYERPIYGGQAIATVKSQDEKRCITVRATAFDPVPAEGGAAAIEGVSFDDAFAHTKFVKMEMSESDRPELTSASTIVSGGRGVGSDADFDKIIEPLADKLGAAIGASRAAVDAGYVPNDYQVGQTGKIVAPELYVAVGISGAIQHLAGMKDSKVIVAINKDEDAPIFSVADYGLVADLFDAVPEMTGKV